MKRIKDFFSRLYFYIIAFLHPIEKKVIFISFAGKQYSDNPRAISEKLHEMYPDFSIVWRINSNEQVKLLLPDYVKVVSTGKQFLKELATSCAYITNCANYRNIAKRKGQFWIQTWHGDIGFKKVLYDVMPDNTKEGTITDSIYTDLCIAGSDYGIQQYHTAFHYGGEIMCYGTPRNDKLIQRRPSEENRTRTILGISENDKVLIYAPTFRDNQESSQEVLVDLVRVMDILHKTSENSWKCIIRAHSKTNGLRCNLEDSRFIDATSYPDMADILAIGDLLISDYSSCATDFIRKGCGAIIAAFDLEEYIRTNREISFDFRKEGFIVADNQKELEDIISSYTYDMYHENAKALCEKFNVVESGNAAELICERIKNHYDGIRKN